MRIVNVLKTGMTLELLDQTLIHWVLATFVFVIVALIFHSPAAGQQGVPARKPGDHDFSIRIGGLERYYSVHVPPSYDPNRLTPVILNFHGGGGNPKSQRTITTMDQASDRFGFLAVYPQGTGAKFKLINPQGYTWNAGTCCGWAMKNGIDDVGYVRAMLDDLAGQFNIDKKRVYATGISNGAMMCYRLACELSDRIAAIAPVAGPIGVTGCKPSRPVSVMHFHGIADQFAPFAGGKGPRSLPGEFFESVEKTIGFWLKQDNINGQPRIVRRGKATGSYYGPGADGSEVVLWAIAEGGHTWPGGKFGFLGKRILGELNTDISANDLMWEFFQRHSLQ
jgi:polyhydroxybutyrate depolymerase